MLARRRGERRDLLTAGFAGGVLGLLCLGAVVLRAAERRSASGFVVDVDRGRLSVVGASAGALSPWLSTILIPHRRGRSAGGPMMATVASRERARWSSA